MIKKVQALNTLHNMQILHRDLKCANVFLSNGSAKIGDMNVSKVAKNRLVCTQTGTPYYASPEVWRDEPLSFNFILNFLNLLDMTQKVIFGHLDVLFMKWLA